MKSILYFQASVDSQKKKILFGDIISGHDKTGLEQKQESKNQMCKTKSSFTQQVFLISEVMRLGLRELNCH